MLCALVLIFMVNQPINSFSNVKTNPLVVQ
jgi:hypothetical protein